MGARVSFRKRLIFKKGAELQISNANLTWAGECLPALEVTSGTLRLAATS
jgi:hypothetical protein